MSKIDPDEMVYEGCDLEAMSQAPNYYRWLVSLIKPYIGQSVVEVGAGSGSFSRQLLTAGAKTNILVEPTKNMFRLLKQMADEASKDRQQRVVALEGYMVDLKKELATHKPDTFVYINVFEHIEDDVAELREVKNLLPKGGHVIVFVPAHQALFSKFDESIGHFRRYSKASAVRLAQAAGLEVVSVRYMDIFGILPWWLSFKVLGQKHMKPGMIGVYDRLFMPVIRTIETAMPMPSGKNVLLIARKN